MRGRDLIFCYVIERDAVDEIDTGRILYHGIASTRANEVENALTALFGTLITWLGAITLQVEDSVLFYFMLK